MIAGIIAKNIEKLRIERGLTQEEAGEILGLSRATYNGVENNKRPVTVDELEKLADYYGVSVDSFFSRPRNVLKFEQMYLYILQSKHAKNNVNII
jgi:transcriptional regulator with XRE-family HTH domain